MSDWAKFWLGIAAFLFCAAVVAVWNLVRGKANQADVDENNKARDDAVNKRFEILQSQNKSQAEEGLRQYRELQMTIDLLKKDITALDKHSLTSTDLVEIKADIKEVIKGQREQVKLIDGMPERLTSLEATRNKQSER